MMVRRLLVCAGALFLILFTSFPSSRALISSPEANHHYPKAILDLKEAIVKGLGFQSDEVKISGFDVRDALVGHAVSYEFDLQIDNKVLPIKLLEDVNRWEYVDLPIFQVEQPNGAMDENGLVPMSHKKKSGDVSPVLAPFQLAGPMELWIQDANNMRLSLPYDVDAGVLKKVILADGAVVTVKGARSVSLRHPIDLPLPLNQSSINEFASGLLSLAEQLRRASSSDQEAPLLSLRIVGPTSLASTSQSPENKLKLKRLAPGLVELSSMSKDKKSNGLSTIGGGATTTVLTPREFTTMWPITSLNGSNANLIGFEKLLTSVLGPRAQEKGSFKVLKADVAAQTFMKIGFGVERKLRESDLEGLNLPAWRTKPETMRMHFEVLAKVDGDKVIPENVMRVDPIPSEDTIAQSVITGNVTMSRLPIIQPPASPFTL